MSTFEERAKYRHELTARLAEASACVHDPNTNPGRLAALVQVIHAAAVVHLAEVLDRPPVSMSVPGPPPKLPPTPPADMGDR
jgi:hypothetical protein